MTKQMREPVRPTGWLHHYQYSFAGGGTRQRVKWCIQDPNHREVWFGIHRRVWHRLWRTQ